MLSRCDATNRLSESAATEMTSTFRENATGWVSIESVTRRLDRDSWSSRSHRAVTEDAWTPRIDSCCTALDEFLCAASARVLAEIVKSSTTRVFLLHLSDDLQDLGSLIVSLALFDRDRDRAPETTIFSGPA